jgi:hypothetical protein
MIALQDSKHKTFIFVISRNEFSFRLITGTAWTAEIHEVQIKQDILIFGFINRVTCL